MRHTCKKNQNVNGFEIIDVVEMVQIIYNDGKMDIFKAIYKANEGVYTGRILNQHEFVNGGFIPKQNIKKIKGGIERKIIKKKSKF
jgi:hypothetical protein